MDPMSALAIAAAVIQFADIGMRLLAKARKKARTRGLPDSRTSRFVDPGSIFDEDRDPATVTELIAQLSAATRILHEASQCLNPGTTGLSDNQFVTIRKRCDDLKNELQCGLPPSTFGHVNEPVVVFGQ